MGLNDLEAQGVYVWSDQSPKNFTHWYSFDNHYEPSEIDENCVCYWDTSSLPYNRGSWFDELCGTYMPYVCKLVTTIDT